MKQHIDTRHESLVSRTTLIAGLALASVTVQAQQSSAWVDATMKNQWNISVDSTNWHGWNDTADCAVAGKTKNVNGGKAEFSGSNGANAGAAVTLANWTVKDGGPVPGWGYMDWEKTPNKQGRTVWGSMNVLDNATNTKAYARSEWTSKYNNGVLWDSVDWSGTVSAALLKIDKNKDLGDGRAASRAYDPYVFTLDTSMMLDLDVRLSEIDMGSESGTGGYGELNWFAAFGTGYDAGINVTDGSMELVSSLNGTQYGVSDGQTFHDSLGFTVLSIHRQLGPGTYWFASGTNGNVGADVVPEPATLSGLAIGIGAAVARRRKR